jgi:carboxypeptidase C (cathepsin A)
MAMFAVLLFLSLSAALVSGQKAPTFPSAAGQKHGYINVNATENANVFYWLFESQGEPSKDPLVLWLTGGPGCASELAIFFENGPFSIDQDLKLKPNPYSWNRRANLLYVDQPVGTGFSYANSDYIFTEDKVATEMYSFLQQFFEMYPQYWRHGQEFFIVGESYAGHYVPAISARIVEENANNKTAIQIPLAGVGVGNGWTDPKTQYGAYGTFAYQNKLIDSKLYGELNETYKKCEALLDAKNWNAAGQVCGSIMGSVLQAAGNINVYNIDLPCDPPPLCYNFSNINRYLNLPSVQESLGVAKHNIKWATCNYAVNEKFVADKYESFRSDLPKVLAAGTRVLVYSGMLDLIW